MMFTTVSIRLSHETLEQIDDAIVKGRPALTDRQEFVELAVEYALQSLREDRNSKTSEEERGGPAHCHRQGRSSTTTTALNVSRTHSLAKLCFFFGYFENSASQTHISLCRSTFGSKGVSDRGTHPGLRLGNLKTISGMARLKTDPAEFGAQSCRRKIRPASYRGSDLSSTICCSPQQPSVVV